MPPIPCCLPRPRKWLAEEVLVDSSGAQRSGNFGPSLTSLTRIYRNDESLDAMQDNLSLYSSFRVANSYAMQSYRPDRIVGSFCMSACMDTLCGKVSPEACAKHCINVCYGLVTIGKEQACNRLWFWCFKFKKKQQVENCLLFYHSLCSSL